MGESVGFDVGQQRFHALKQANEVRLARAEIKGRIRDGEQSVAEVVCGCCWQVHGMAISDLLMSQRRWGASRCRRLLVSVGIPENKAVGTLTERQRIALLAVLEERTEPPRRALSAV